MTSCFLSQIPRHKPYPNLLGYDSIRCDSTRPKQLYHISKHVSHRKNPVVSYIPYDPGSLITRSWYWLIKIHTTWNGEYFIPKIFPKQTCSAMSPNSPPTPLGFKKPHRQKQANRLKELSVVWPHKPGRIPGSSHYQDYCTTMDHFPNFWGTLETTKGAWGYIFWVWDPPRFQWPQPENLP